MRRPNGDSKKTFQMDSRALSFDALHHARVKARLRLRFGAAVAAALGLLPHGLDFAAALFTFVEMRTLHRRTLRGPVTRDSARTSSR